MIARKMYIVIAVLASVFASCDHNVMSISSEDPSLVIADSIYTYAGEFYNGVITSDPQSPFVSTQYDVKHGQLHGDYQEWHSHAQLKTDKHFRKGKEHGKQKGYHYNGKLSYEYACNNGLRQGLYKEYFPSGSLQIKRQYDKGKEVRNKILDYDGKVLAHYVIRDGEYYGLLSFSNCISVINEEKQQ